MKRAVFLVAILVALAGCSGPPATDDADPPPMGDDGDPDGGDDPGDVDGADGGNGSGAVADPLSLNTTVERTTVDGDPAANVTLQVRVNWPDLSELTLGIRSSPGFDPIGEDRTSVPAPDQGSTHRWQTHLSLPSDGAQGWVRTWATSNQTSTSRVSATETVELDWDGDRLSTQATDWPHDGQGGLGLDVEPGTQGTASVTATLYTNEITRQSRVVADAIDGSASIGIEHPKATVDGSGLDWRGETTPDGVELSFNLSLAGEGQAQTSISLLPPLNVDAAQYGGSIVLTNESGNVTVDRVQDDPPPRGGGEVSQTEGGG